jgi:hypothetical protein
VDQAELEENQEREDQELGKQMLSALQARVEEAKVTFDQAKTKADQRATPQAHIAARAAAVVAWNNYVGVVSTYNVARGSPNAMGPQTGFLAGTPWGERGAWTTMTENQQNAVIGYYTGITDYATTQYAAHDARGLQGWENVTTALTTYQAVQDAIQALGGHPQ